MPNSWLQVGIDSPSTYAPDGKQLFHGIVKLWMQPVGVCDGNTNALLPTLNLSDAFRNQPMRRILKITFTPPRICVRVIQVVAFNALLIAVALALIGVVGELYFRVRAPYGFAANPKDFGYHTWQGRFVHNVGNVTAPNQKIRYSNHMDFWTITQVNSLGFLDREPVSPKRAAESCHIALIGDSFVVGKEVDIADKSQVKLEELAARELPHLDVTTSAFGRGSFGQINQLAFYDEYARHLRPKVVALVFVNNDFGDNSPIISALRWGTHPEHMPILTAARGADGALELRPPDPDYGAFKLRWPPIRDRSFYEAFVKRAENPDKYDGNRYYHFAKLEWEAVKYSYFAKWLDVKVEMMFYESSAAPWELILWRAELLRQQPRYSTFLQEWTPNGYRHIDSTFAQSDLPPVFEEALAYTEFGLEQFKRRADRDGVKLVILSTHSVKIYGNLAFERLTAMAEKLDIPIIDQHEYIVSIGADPRNAEFKHDFHWNEDGHRWAAEALLGWLKNNQDVCDEQG